MYTSWLSNAEQSNIRDYTTSFQMHCNLSCHYDTHYTPHLQSELFLKIIADKKYCDLDNGLLLILLDKPDDVATTFRFPALLGRLVDTRRSNIIDEMDLLAAPTTLKLDGPQLLDTHPCDDDTASPPAPAKSLTTHIQGYVNCISVDRQQPCGKADRTKSNN